MQVAIAILGGLLVGALMGALGGGGAILAVPIFVYLLGFHPASATVAALWIVIVAALTALVGHYRRGNVRTLTGIVFGLLGVGGSYGGSKLSGVVSEHILMCLFAALLVLVGALMLRTKPSNKGATHQERPTTWRQWVLVVLSATVVGFLAGFFGVGGGFAIVPALTLVVGFAMPYAVGTSLIVIITNSVLALLFQGGIAEVPSWAPFLTFGACAAIASIFGATITQRISPQNLKRAFGILLQVLAAFILVSEVIL